MSEDDVRPSVKIMRFDEYVSQLMPLTSEQRLLRLPGDSWSPSDFVLQIAQLHEQLKLTVSSLTHPASLPALSPDTWFKYSGFDGGSYEAAGEQMAAADTQVRVAVVTREGRIVAYGIARTDLDASEIEIIDVDRDSRRSAGIHKVFEIDGEQFSVGLGHVIAYALIDALPRPIRVDATTSQYIFQSLGFRHRPGAASPCELELAEGDPRAETR
jgi:hypothetical protein